MLISYRLKNKHVLVIGSGKEVPGRVIRALESEANVTYLSTDRPSGFNIPHPRCVWIEQEFDPKYLDGEDLSFGSVDMVLCCSEDPAESRFVYEICRSKKIPINCADMPEYCDFCLMAQFKEGPLEIGVSTNENAPRLAVRFKKMIQEIIPPGSGEAIQNIALLRKKIKEHDPEHSSSKRRSKWITVFCDKMSIPYLASLKEADFTSLIQDYDANVIQEPVFIQHNTGSLLTTVVYISANSLASACRSVVTLPFALTSFVLDAIWSRPNQNRILLGRSVAYDDDNNLMLITGPEPVQLSFIERATLLPGQVISLGIWAMKKPFDVISSFVKKPLNNPGKAIIVGAGPGDPQLLTIKALEAMRSADIIISDQLVSPDIVRVVERMVGKRKLTFVTKRLTNDSNQDSSNALALEFLSRGKTVVRLKVGDPFLYGRGCEEMLYFKKQGYQVEIIPGLASCLAGPTAIGVPVTHRGYADSVIILNGRGQHGNAPDIPKYQIGRTVLILMGIPKIREIGQLLIEMEYPPELGCGILEKATWSNGQQKWTKMKVKDIVKVDCSAFESPSVIIIGRTVDIE